MEGKRSASQNGLLSKVFMLILMVVALSLSLMTTKVHASPKLEKKQISMQAGTGYILKLRGNKDKVVWKSSKKSVVQIVYSDTEKALLSAKKTGKVTISAKIGKKTYKCKVTVKKAAKMPKNLTIIEGYKYTLSVSKKSNWTVGGGNVVKTSGQKNTKKVVIQGVHAGKCMITAKSKKKTV